MKAYPNKKRPPSTVDMLRKMGDGRTCEIVLKSFLKHCNKNERDDLTEKMMGGLALQVDHLERRLQETIDTLAEVQTLYEKSQTQLAKLKAKTR